MLVFAEEAVDRIEVEHTVDGLVVHLNIHRAELQFE
jgi:hypothetical protein